MRIPHMLFGIDPQGTAVVLAIMDLHRDEPARSCTAHHYFDELDKVGLDATCRRIGMVVLNVMRLKHPEALAPFDIVPAPTPADRLPDNDTNVIRLFVDHGLRAPHLAVGISDSGMMLDIDRCEANGTRSISLCIPFRELHSEGPETASVRVGELILREVIALHPDPFSPYPTLAF